MSAPECDIKKKREIRRIPRFFDPEFFLSFIDSFCPF